jgi:Helix-turn-helix domain
MARRPHGRAVRGSTSRIENAAAHGWTAAFCILLFERPPASGPPNRILNHPIEITTTQQEAARTQSLYMHPAPTFDNDLNHSQADKPKFMRGMFLWLQQVATDRELPPMALHVATALASHVNQKTKEAFPWQKTLANTLSITMRAVQRNVAELTARGHLRVIGPSERYKPNRYFRS